MEDMEMIEMKNWNGQNMVIGEVSRSRICREKTGHTDGFVLCAYNCYDAREQFAARGYKWESVTMGVCGKCWWKWFATENEMNAEAEEIGALV
jgi:hypothetical protein